MRKVLLLGLLIASCVAGYFYFFQDSVPVSTPAITKKSHSSSRKLFLGARTKKLPKSNSAASDIQDGCEDLTRNLESMDFNAPVDEWVLNFDKVALKNCQLPLLTERLEMIQKHCFEELDEGLCAMDAVFLRAQLRTRNVEDAEDQELIADLIINEFAHNKPDFDKLNKLSEKMMVLDPDQKAYQKLWASSKVISKLFKGKSPMDVAEEINGRVNPELWNDPALNGIKMAMMTGLEPSNVEDYARGYLTQKPDAVMHEVLGWSLWKQNRRAEAIDQLQQAIKMNPKDTWLKDQLKKVRGKGANAESYQTRIMLGLDMRDLYN